MDCPFYKIDSIVVLAEASRAGGRGRREVMGGLIV